jgi:phosphate transport system permease protein
MAVGATIGPATSSLSRSRRAKDRVFTTALWASAIVAMLPLVLIVTYVLRKGASVLSASFFLHPAAPVGVPGGGLEQSFIGTGIIMGLAILFSVPVGVLAALYLSEFGHARFAKVVRFVAEILLSTPSIIAGAFIWALVVVTLGSFSAFAGALALTVLMWPIIARATEEVLRLVPRELREGGLALGLPRWKVTLRVVVPSALAGMFTAIMLAVARGLGETAPILLTALGNDFVNTNPLRPTDALPLRIYSYAQSPFPDWVRLAWGGALMLLAGVLLLSITARIFSSRQRRRMR